jgi:DNA-binding NarL/FixJ family response regulator
LTAQYLAELSDDICQVEVVGSATESKAGLRPCAEVPPDAVFVDINLPGKVGVLLATQLTMLRQSPRLVFTTGVYCSDRSLRCAYGPADGAEVWRPITAIRTIKSRFLKK